MPDGEDESSQFLRAGIAHAVTPDVKAAVIDQELIDILVQDVQFGPCHAAEAAEAQNDIGTGGNGHVIQKDLAYHLGQIPASGELDAVAAGLAVDADAHLDLVFGHGHDGQSGDGVDGAADADAVGTGEVIALLRHSQDLLHALAAFRHDGSGVERSSDGVV